MSDPITSLEVYKSHDSGGSDTGPYSPSVVVLVEILLAANLDPAFQQLSTSQNYATHDGCRDRISPFDGPAVIQRVDGPLCLSFCQLLCHVADQFTDKGSRTRIPLCDRPSIVV